jgi:hypothetical protein
VQADMGDDPCSTRFHNDTKRAGSVHLGSALLVRGPVA